MKENMKFQICHIKNSDKEFWFTLDKHLSVAEFDKKVRDKQGYILRVDDKPIGILRYNLFWDNTPFCTLLYVKKEYQKQGYGKALIDFWENEMLSLGYKLLLTSTQADEDAQHFYRKIGYSDCGGLILTNQATELFLQKTL